MSAPPLPTGAERFMQRAIEISRDEMRANGAAPFGAVVVKNGEIVGEGVNQVVRDHDPTSHGEVEAIRDAGRKLGTWDLTGCDLYTTCEPCEMCVAAMYWARIDRLFYANTLSDVEELGLDLAPLRRMVRSDLDQRDQLPAQRVSPEPAHEVLVEWTSTANFKAFKG